VVFAIGGLAILGALVVPLPRGDAPFAFGLVWGSFAMAFGAVWVRDYGAAVHNVAANVNRDSPGSPVTWHRGLDVVRVAQTQRGRGDRQIDHDPALGDTLGCRCYLGSCGPTVISQP
jgi:hypothetical protein